MPSILELYLRTSDATLTAGSRAVPAHFAGMHIGNLSLTNIYADYDPGAENYPAGGYRPTPAPDLPVKILRMWDINGCTPRNIFRPDGSEYWDDFDHALDVAEAQGYAGVIINLGCWPDHLTAPHYGQTYHKQPGNPIGWHVDYNPHKPANIAVDCPIIFARIAQRTLGRNLRFYYSPWNEANDDSFGGGDPAPAGVGFVGSVADMIQIITIMRNTIAPIDPTAIFLSPSFTGAGLSSGTGAAVNLDACLAAGMAMLVDVIAVHGYSDFGPQHQPEQILSFADAVQQVMRKHAVSLPVWNEEWGLSSYIGADGSPQVVEEGAPQLGDARGVATVARMVLCNMIAGFDLFALFQLDWRHSASRFVDADAPGTLLPAAQAWGYVIGLFTGARLSWAARPQTGAAHYGLRFRLADGRRGLIYWLIGYPKWGSALPVSQPIPMPEGVTEIRDALGQAVAIGATLTIGDSPQILFLGD